MQGETEAPQKVEVTPESIRRVEMQAQAGMETTTDAFVFYTPPRPGKPIENKALKANRYSLNLIWL